MRTTGGDDMIRLPAVGGETCIPSAPALLNGEWDAGPPGTIQVHGDMLVGSRGRLVGKRAGGKGKAGWMGWRLGPRWSSGRVIVLHMDGSRQVGLECSWDGTSGR